MPSNLRVLHVLPYFPPDRIGGVGEVASHIHQGLLARGHESAVLTSGTSKADPRIVRIATTPTRFALKCAAFSNLLSEYDVIHCHHSESIALLTMNWLRGIKKPVVCTYHCSCHGIANAHLPYSISDQRFGGDLRAVAQARLIAPIRSWLDRLNLKLVDAPNFISKHGRADILGRNDDESSVIYYGLPGHENAAPPAVEKPDPVEILYAGTASHRKRINALPFLLERVRQHHPNAKLRIVGFYLENHPELLALAKQLGVREAIDDVGPMTSKMLPPYYRAARVVVVPSAHEGIPMVILESQQCGVPTVATNVSGHPEAITHGHNGFLSELDDIDSMAAHCVELLGNQDLWETMSRNAKAVIHTQFSLARQIDEYVALYEQAIAKQISPVWTSVEASQ